MDIKCSIKKMLKKVCWWNWILKLFKLFADEMFKGMNTPMDHWGQEVPSYLQLLLERVGAKVHVNQSFQRKKDDG